MIKRGRGVFLRMKKRRIVCLLLSLIVMMAMSTATADAASFKSKPTGVKAKCVTGVSVQVSCKAKKGAKGYQFYYATKKSGKYKLGATSKTRTGTVKGLTPGKTYYFKVKAYKGKSKKTYTKMSKPVKCKTVLKAPGVAFKDKCCCRIALKLSGSPGCKGYKIYRSTNRYVGFEKVGTTSATTWLNEGLDSSTTYYYKVRSYSGSYHSPYSAVITVKTKDIINGNHSRYSPSDSKELVPAPGNGNNNLTGRKLLFLGSSITKGLGAENTSFADYIRVRDKAKVNKLAENGTTMARPSVADSYVRRLHNNDPESFVPDIFVCQLSLNDSLAKNNVKLGTLPVIESGDLSPAVLQDLYDNSTTVGGAIGYITAYASYYWPDSQIVFFTVRNNGYNTQYIKMRTMLYDAQKQYGNIKIIDMWSIKELTNLKNDLSTFCLYMRDDNHPKMAGYLYQWTPVFEKKLDAWMPPVSDSTCTVTWKNYDGTILDSYSMRYGDALSYSGDTPTRGDDEQYTYEFKNWKCDITGKNYTNDQIGKLFISRDITFVAQFDEIKKQVDPSEPGEQNDPGEVVNPGTDNIQKAPANDNDKIVIDEPTDNSDEVDQGDSEGGAGDDAVNGADDGDKIENEVLDITGMLDSLLRAA